MINFTKEELLDILEVIDVAHDEGIERKTHKTIFKKIEEELESKYNYLLNPYIDEFGFKIYSPSLFGLTKEEAEAELHRRDIMREMNEKGILNLYGHIYRILDKVYQVFWGLEDKYSNRLESQIPFKVEDIENQAREAIYKYFNDICKNSNFTIRVLDKRKPETRMFHMFKITVIDTRTGEEADEKEVQIFGVNKNKIDEFNFCSLFFKTY